jgi:hypothetical protein
MVWMGTWDRAGLALTLPDGSGHTVRSVSGPGTELGWATALGTVRAISPD